MDPIKGHGQAPHGILSLHLCARPEGPGGPPSRGSLKVSSWAASIAVTVNPSQAPGPGATPVSTAAGRLESHFSVGLRAQREAVWGLTGATLGSKHTHSSLVSLLDGRRWEDSAFRLGSWWTQSLAPRRQGRDVDKAKR